MGPKYQPIGGDKDDSIVYSGDDADNEHDNQSSPQMASGNNLLLIDTTEPKVFADEDDEIFDIQKNPLCLSQELKDAIKRAGEKQLQYEIPVDLDQCTEEEKRHWLIKRANIRNGGRPRSNPLYDGRQIDPEVCKDSNGDWTKFI